MAIKREAGRLTDALRTNSTYRRAAVDHDDVRRSNGRERGRAMEWKTSENYRLNLSRHNSSMTTPSGRREEKQLLYNYIFYFVRLLFFWGLKLSAALFLMHWKYTKLHYIGKAEQKQQ